ncbi:protein Flattop [Pristis pectinata]|uniref:protein Flattop n=1 Tax=Pristis pectinata TaxID=685728 RepID=UPI00223D2ED4|nr:protein Flattop [Pristis pectinata]
MAYSYHANQYEGAYNNTRMNSWTVPKPRDQTSKRPTFREGSSFFIANDKGYLKPGVPRSKANPWGTFLGTWQMPHHIPQPRPNLTARNPANAARLLNQVKASPLYRASNGFGLQAMFPHCVEQVPEETFEESCGRTRDSPVPPPRLPTRLSDREAAAGGSRLTGAPPTQICPSPPRTQESGRVMTPGMRGQVSGCPEFQREDPAAQPDPTPRCRSPLIG